MECLNLIFKYSLEIYFIYFRCFSYLFWNHTYFYITGMFIFCGLRGWVLQVSRSINIFLFFIYLTLWRRMIVMVMIIYSHVFITHQLLEMKEILKKCFLVIIAMITRKHFFRIFNRYTCGLRFAFDSEVQNYKKFEAWYVQIPSSTRKFKWHDSLWHIHTQTHTRWTLYVCVTYVYICL